MVAMGFVAGCGFQGPYSIIPQTGCVTGPLISSQSGSPNFTLVPSVNEITIYPGQTEQLPVFVKPVGSAQGQVSVGGFYADGLTVSSATATIGSTVNLTLTAANNVAYSCFNSYPGVFSAGQKMTLIGSSTSGSITQQVPLNIVLENASYQPASFNLPVMSIVTDGGAAIDSEDDYVNATLTITDSATPSNNYTGKMGIKGHGNSTWVMPKKPYRLNLNSKAPLLGMTSDSNWILLANYDDKSMLRTDLSFKMSQIFGQAWTPSTAFVEVYLNGAYNGTYQLSEKVEVSKARLNIGSMDDTDNSGTNLTGGYLGEIDHYNGETYMMTSLVGLPIGIADPDPPTTQQAAYFNTAFTAAEASMYSPSYKDPATGWQAYWDEDSLVSWFLVEELAGNQDADDFSSDYFYKPRGDSLFYRGPVWDMDITLGNDWYGTIGQPNVPWVRDQSLWYKQLFTDPAFVNAVKAKWTAVRPQLNGLPDYLDTRAAALTLASQNNYGRWPTLGERVWPNAEAAGTYNGEVTFMKSWLTQRIAYMDSMYLQK